MVAPNAPVKHAKHSCTSRQACSNNMHNGKKSRMKRRGASQRLWLTVCVSCEMASTQQTHTPPAVTNMDEKRHTAPPPPVKSHGQRDTATALKPTNIAHGASNHPKSHMRKRILTQP
ncbi:exo-alpha-sialidase [Trypanosoma cruzi]|nr:exo-alpha-sialidase [Trypanosoma cruzi]